MKIEKNIFDKWKLLLRVLSEEIPEDDSYFQHGLNENPENQELYLSLIEGKQNNKLFDKDQVFNNISNKLNLNTERKKPLYKKKWFQYVASSVAVIALFFIALNHFTFLENTIPEKAEKNIFDPGSKKAYLL